MSENTFKGLMEGVAGIRGIVGAGLTPEIVCKYAAAYGTMMGPGEIIVGRDGRPTGVMVFNAVCAGLQSVGCKVVDLGIAPTPTIQVVILQRKAAGGVAITASHNPQEWNALKFFAVSSLFLDEAEGAELKRIMNSGDIKYVPWDKLGKYSRYRNALEDHIKAILDIPFLNLGAVRRKEFKTVVDCVNASGSKVFPQLLAELGCSVHKVSCECTGIFPRIAEPSPENLTDLGEAVVESKADIGFAVDPDGDRLAIVDERGKPIGEEYTVTLAADFLLRHKKGPIAVNVSTTRAMDDLAAKYGVELHRSKVGEVHVAKLMKSAGAVIGGEGNGGVILPEAHLGRDGLVGAALILQHMAEMDMPLSQIVAKLPQYRIVKDKISIDGLDKYEIFARIEASSREAVVDKTDGIKLIYPRSWIQARASNTEPIIRIFAEASQRVDAERLVEHLKAVILGKNTEGE